MDRNDRHGSERDGSVMADMLKGAIAGAVGVWVMDRVDWFLYDHEDPRARRRTQRVRPGGLDPAHVAVNRAARMMGRELSPRQPHPAGVALHYGIGIGPGALYATMRHRMQGLGMARGPLYGLGLFVAQDEVVNAITGLSAPPRRYPWQAHARGLVAHLVYGLVTDLALDAMDAVERSLRQPHSEEDRLEEGRHAEVGGGGPRPQGRRTGARPDERFGALAAAR